MTSRRFTTDTAAQAASEGRLDDWVTAFLASPGSDNEALAAKLALDGTTYHGPVEVDLAPLVPLAGPDEADVLVPVDDDRWSDDIDAMRDQVADGWEPPPLLVSYQEGQLFIEDGNHRREALLQQGVTRAPAIVFFPDEAARDEFTTASG